MSIFGTCVTICVAICVGLNKRYMSGNKRLTFPLIFKELHKNHNTDSFNKFFEDVIKDPPEYLHDETMKRYHSALFNLNKYNPDIKFADQSEELFQGFHKWCLTQAKLASSTVNAYFNARKKVVSWARKLTSLNLASIRCQSLRLSL